MLASLRLVLLVVLALLTVAVLVPVQGAAVTDNSEPAVSFDCGDPLSESVPDSRDGILTELRGLEGGSGIDSYSEFELVRSEAVLDVQIGSFEATDRQRNQNLLLALRSFEHAYDCFEEGNYRAALDRANETTALINEFDDEVGVQYQSAIDLALSRFYEDIGAELVRIEAEETESTPERIETLSMAAISFRQAGASERFSQLSIQLDELEREFEQDMQTVDDAVETGEQFTAECDDCTAVSTVIFERQHRLFPMYETGVGAESELAEARGILDEHGVESTTVDQTGSAVDQRTDTLAVSATIVLVSVSVVVAVVASLVARRLVIWKQDVTAASAGDLLLWGGLINE